MRVASVGVYVREESPMSERAVARQSGEPWAWLELGADAEVSLYGSPAAMRRLAAALLGAAAAAERLPSEHQSPTAAAREAVARS
jgi:hypothetical protein